MDVSVSTRSDQSEICAAITEAEHRICQDDVDATVVVTDNPAELDDFNDTPLVVPVPSAPAVNTTQLCELLDRIDRDEHTETVHTLLTVQQNDTSLARISHDLTLVTTEPAHISEYRVSPKQSIRDSFRADGVVLATPLGSDGYAHAAGGAVLHPTAGVAVVPISPFTTDTTSWVLSPPLTLTVERDDEIYVVADGKTVATVGESDVLTIDSGPAFVVASN